MLHVTSHSQCLGRETELHETHNVCLWCIVLIDISILCINGLASIPSKCTCHKSSLANAEEVHM